MFAVAEGSQGTAAGGADDIEIEGRGNREMGRRHVTDSWSSA